MREVYTSQYALTSAATALSAADPDVLRAASSKPVERLRARHCIQAADYRLGALLGGCCSGVNSQITFPMDVHALGDRETLRSVSARAFAPFQLIWGAHDID